MLSAACASPVSAADYAPSVHEVWSGIYRCGAMQTESGTSPGYTSSIRLVVEGNTATINKRSGEISETLSGEIARDGTLRLEGTGTRRSDRAGWRYRYQGRFEGSRFEARGMMYSANLATRLRECSMTLARMQRSDTPAVAPDVVASGLASTQAGALAQAQPQSTPPQRDAAGAGQTSKTGRASLPPKSVDRELDFSDRNDSAMVEGTVERGAPHRYNVIAKHGQRFSATLQSEEGARFDLYEPGSSITVLSGGFVVQGARLAANDEGTHVETRIPADGKYLLLVRPARDSAFYTLDIAVEGGPPTLGQRWWSANKGWFAAAGVALVLLVVLIVRRRRRKRNRRMFGPD
jgi:LPXTG-motif cell wall-anchored protein